MFAKRVSLMLTLAGLAFDFVNAQEEGGSQEEGGWRKMTFRVLKRALRARF